MIKAREAKSAASTDLLICFPSRAHLTLMPKPICSPARPSDSNKRHHNKHHLKKSTTRGGGRASPLLWNKSKSMGSEISEPTSPKVTCAGQIKVRPKTSARRSWQSVMEDIEKIHSNRKQKKKPSWAESIGFKKEIMQFLTCLRRIRFDLRCFGSFPEADVTSDDEDDEEDEKLPENHEVVIDESANENSRTLFSKWLMVLQENQSSEFRKEEERKEKDEVEECDESIAEPAVPPRNALLLMRCRSAPAKSWLKENAEEEREEDDEKEEEEEEEEVKKGQSLRSLMEEEKRKKENLVVMRYDSDFYKISTDIARETWIVGGLRDSLCKSRSWKK